MTQVWIVAQVKSFDERGWARQWDLGGVFSTEEKALSVCSTPSDAIWSVPLDEFLGRETMAPPGIIYPVAREET